MTTTGFLTGIGILALILIAGTLLTFWGVDHSGQSKSHRVNSKPDHQ